MTMHFRQGAAAPQSVNTDERTVEAIVSTGADVPRGGYVERLDLRGADLSRLVGGPVLDAHRTATTSAQLGVIEAAELRPEGLWVRMKLRDSTAGRQVLTDIWDGTLRGLSIGYTVQKVADSREGDKRIRTATAWTPFEVSIVPVPADPGAHFRNGDSIMEQTTQEAEQQTADPDAAATRAQLNAEIAASPIPPGWRATGRTSRSTPRRRPNRRAPPPSKPCAPAAPRSRRGPRGRRSAPTIPTRP